MFSSRSRECVGSLEDSRHGHATPQDSPKTANSIAAKRKRFSRVRTKDSLEDRKASGSMSLSQEWQTRKQDIRQSLASAASRNKAGETHTQTLHAQHDCKNCTNVHRPSIDDNDKRHTHLKRKKTEAPLATNQTRQRHSRQRSLCF